MDINYIRKRLKKYRKLKKLTQEELAEKSNISIITLHRWEKGTRSPSINGLQKIAEALGVSLSDLISPIPLEEARKQAGYSEKELADKIGVDLKTYLRWEHYLEIPPPEIQEKLQEILEEKIDFSIHIDEKTNTFTQKITEDFPGALIKTGLIEETENGYKFVDSIEKVKEFIKKHKKAVEETSEPESSNAEYITSNMLEVPIINYSAGAGRPFVIREIETYIENYLYIPKGFVSNGKLFAIRVRGDSMEPRFKEGDYAVVNADAEVLSGQIAVVQIDMEDLLLKQIFWRDARQKVELASFNPKYEPRIVNTEEISFMGKVVGKWESIV